MQVAPQQVDKQGGYAVFIFNKNTLLLRVVEDNCVVLIN
jgi:hypothetical protein